jgi:cellobiose-specific phosphotransferase system component IIA
MNEAEKLAARGVYERAVEQSRARLQRANESFDRAHEVARLWRALSSGERGDVEPVLAAALDAMTEAMLEER